MRALLVSACATAFLGTAALDAAAPLGLQGWRAEGGGAATLPSDGRSLALSYDSPEKAPVKLLPPAPVPLPDGATRISLWFARLSGDFKIAFELRDAKGVSHSLKSSTSRMVSDLVMWDQKRRGDWSIWNKAESAFFRPPSAKEFERAVLPEDKARVEALLWPRPLTLTAIRLEPAAAPGWHAPGADKDVKAGKGSLVLTELRVEDKDGFQAESYWLFPERSRSGKSGRPFLLPDDLSSLSGQVRYLVELRRGYFGPLVWSAGGTLSIDRSKPMDLFDAKIEFPALEPGRYFLSSKAWRPDGTLEREQPLLTLWILQNQESARLSPATSDFIWTAETPGNVFPSASKRVSLQLKAEGSAWAAVPADALCVAKVLRSDRTLAFEASFKRGEKPAVEMDVEAGEDYFAIAEIQAGGKAYDRTHLHFGVASKPESPSGEAPASIPSRDEFLKGNAELTGEYWYGSRAREYPWFSNMEAGGWEGFDQWMGMLAAAGVKVVSAGDIWGSHELLPGVYQWKELDSQVEMARRHGLTVQFGYTADGNALFRNTIPLWADSTLSRDQNGDAPGDPSFWSPATVSGRAAYYKLLATHFLGNPTVSGYRIRTCNMRAPGYASSRIDYSEDARTAFKKWLAASGKPEMEMGRLFALPGVNDAHLGPDLSPEWRSFTEFNSYTARSSALNMSDAIREVDRKRMVIVDEKPFPYAIESLIPYLKDGGVLKNEDSPNFGTAALRSMCAQAGVPYVEELHNHMPTSRSIADATDFWSSYHSATIFWLLRGRPEMISSKPVKAAPDTWNQNTEAWLLDYMRESRAAWREWIKAKPFEPETLLFGSRAQGLLGNRRMGSDFDIGGMDAYSSLVCSLQVPCHFADEYATWCDLKRFKLVFAASEIMADSAIKRLSDYAANGGRLVLVGDAGRLCPERPGERDVLSKSVASAPNVMRIKAPKRLSLPGVLDWAAPYALDAQEVGAALAWAGVKRPAFVKAEAALGFETQVRYGEGGSIVYVASLRRWPGWYWNNIEREDVLLEKYGKLGGRLSVFGLRDGVWKVEKIHRDRKALAPAASASGELSFDIDSALAGEVQIFKLTRAD